MKKLVLLIVLSLIFFSCETYKYTRVQYDSAMNSWLKGRLINDIMKGCPFPNQQFSDGKGGTIVKMDLSTNYTTPQYSNSNTYSQYQITPNYNGINIQNNSSTSTYTVPSRTVKTNYYISLWVNNEGYIYSIDYFLSPKMLNTTYEDWKEGKDYFQKN